MYFSNNFKVGKKVIFNNEPYVIDSAEFVKPGKGQVFSRIQMRNLLTKKILEKTFRSTDSLKVANIEDINASFLYREHKSWYFMNTKNFEQLEVQEKVIGSTKKWISSSATCSITMWNGNPISIVLSNFVMLRVLRTSLIEKNEPLISGTQIAILKTNARVRVPLFIKENDIIKIDTRTGKYVSRKSKN